MNTTSNKVTRLDRFLDYLVDQGVLGKILLVAAFAVVVYVFVTVVQNANEEVMIRQEETRKLTDFCYSKGMVSVQTDAGPRCADPSSLVKAK